MSGMVSSVCYCSDYRISCRGGSLEVLILELVHYAAQRLRCVSFSEVVQFAGDVCQSKQAKDRPVGAVWRWKGPAVRGDMLRQHVEAMPLCAAMVEAGVMPPT